VSELSINQGVEMRNAQLELHHFRLRLAIAGGFVLFMFFLLGTRFFYLQVIRHGELHTLAEANRISVVPVVPNRGIIVDRNGIALANNYSAYTLEIQPAKVSGSVEALIDELATVVEISARDRRRFKRLQEESKSIGSLPIRTRLSDEEIARFAANRYRFPGVDINARLFRQYPQGEMFSHVVGHIGRINPRELEQLEADGLHANYRGTEAALRALPPRHHGRGGSGDRFRRAPGAHALAHVAGIRQQSDAEPRRAAAGGRLRGVR
jgi:penicillin-binding protein 2